MIRRVIAASRQGLCNRLKVLLSAWRMAEAMGAEPLLYWPLTAKVPVSFRGLFREGPTEIDEAQYHQLAKDPDSNIVLDGWRFSLLPSDDVVPDKSLPYAPRDGRAIDFAYAKTPSAIMRDFLRHANRLNPTEKLAGRIERFAHDLDSDSVAVHIRTWNIMGDEKPVFYRFENYLRALKPHRGKLLFVAADNPEVIETLQQRHIGEVRSLPLTSRGHETPEQLEDAVCELFLLSRPPVLIGSFVSTFSEIAWWLGGCRQAITIVEPRKYLFKFLTEEKYCLGWKWTLRHTDGRRPGRPPRWLRAASRP
jgi:hypothetical protein